MQVRYTTAFFYTLIIDFKNVINEFIEVMKEQQQKFKPETVSVCVCVLFL